MEGHLPGQWVVLVVEEGERRTTVHQVEEEGTLGEEAVLTQIKPEGEGVLIVVALVVQV